MEELSYMYVFNPIFCLLCSCSLIFFTTAHFHLAGREHFSLGPFLRGKIRRVLHKTRTVPLIRRVLAKPRLILDEMCRLYGKFASYLRRVLCKTRLIFPRINGPIVSQPLWIFMFFFLQNSFLLFSITRSSSFSVIHVSVNIKNNVQKDTTSLLFFLSKGAGGHAISFQIKPWVAFELPYLLIELFYMGMPVVRTDGRAVGRSVYVHVITKFSRMGSLPHFFTHGAVRASRARAPL